MEIQRTGFSFRLEPNPGQARLLRQAIGSARWVWNRGLQSQKERYQADQPNLGYSKLCAKLTTWKQEFPWLAGPTAQTLQQKLKDLNQAFSNFFQNPGHFEPPTFKRKADGGSIRYPQGFHLDNANGRVFLPKIGWVPYRKSRNVTGTPKNVTIGFRNSRFSVSIQTEQEVEIPIHPHKDAAVGIDLGIVNHTTLFDGQEGHSCPGPKALTRRQRKIARLQRQLSRKKKFSQNWKKQKIRLARAHHKISNVRHDHLHRLSTTIAKNHGIIVLEDLQVANMSHSAKGTIEAAGRNVRAKAGLNRSILDQGWSKFRTLLEYKVHRRGGRLIAVPAQHTSQSCPECQHVSQDNRRTQARFACVQCGFEENADVAAAMNILAAGQAVIACGGHPVAGPMNQEPPVSLAA